MRVVELSGEYAKAVPLTNYCKQPISKIFARNIEQKIALNFLMDPDIDLVVLLGAAGTGKTLLALAAGLEQSGRGGVYEGISATRAPVPFGEDIGFLPGTAEEKTEPWMGAFTDNMRALGSASEITTIPFPYLRGRTFTGEYLIVDEVQNLTRHQIRTVITRAGEGTKVVCLGNLKQIDTPYLTEADSGLTYLVEKLKSCKHAAHVILQEGVRSRLAEWANQALV